MSDRFGKIPIQNSEPLPSEPPPAPEPSGSASRPPAPKARKNTGPGRRPLARIWLLFIIFTAFIGCYSALGFIGVPYYFTTVLPENFYEKTKMVVVPKAVHFNPFTLQFTTGATRIFAPSGGSILTLDSLQADIAPLAALRGNIVCQTLSIDNLVINITRELDGTYNLQPLLSAAQKGETSAVALSELPSLVSLNNISITNSKIVFNDRLADKIHTLEKIQLELPTFSNATLKSEQYLRPHFSAIVNGSPIKLTGQASLGQTGQAQAMRLAIDINDLDLPTYAGYLPFSLPMQCSKGTANGTIDLIFNPQNSQQDTLSIGFSLQTTGVELVNDQRQLTIEVPSARVAGKLQPMSRTLQLQEVALREPTVSSFGSSWRENHVAGEQKTREQAAPYQILVELLLVDNGTVRSFATKADPQPASVWKNVQFSVKNYRSGKQAAGNQTIAKRPAGSFRLAGEKAGSSASFSWQGTFSAQDNLTGSFQLFRVDGQELLKTIGDNHPFTSAEIQGDADLRGQLSLYTQKEDANRLHYKLADAELTLNDFTLSDNEQSILEAPLVKLSGLSVIDETIDFGTIQLHNASAWFVPGRLPKIYRQFTLPQYRLQALDYEGKVLFNPQKKSAPPLLFSEVSLKANELGSAAKLEDNFSIAASTAAGAVFKAQGKVTLSPFSARLTSGFRQLSIDTVRPFFSSSAIPAELQGTLSGKGILSLPVPGFAGELELGEVVGNGPQNTPFSWQKSIVSGVKYTTRPLHLSAASARVDGAHFSWQITDESSGPLQHFSQFMQNYFPVAGKVAPPAPDDAPAPVTIEEITFTESTLDIQDDRLTPAWTAENVQFAGSIKNIHSTPATESQFSFTGRLTDSPFTVAGSVAPFRTEENGTLHFSLDALPLALFANQFAGINDLDTSSSQVSLLLDSSWQEQQYISSGKLILNGLEPLTASSDMALPLALLSDSSGTIEVPFTFSRTAPVAQTSLAEELYSTVEHLLLKGRVSPLLLASGDFTDLIGTDTIDFHPGEVELTDSGRKTLSRYAQLLIAHPRAALVLSGGADKEIDVQAMQQSLRAVEQQRVDLENEKLLQQWQEEKTRYQQRLTELQDSDAQENIFEQDIPPAILSDFEPLSPRPVQIDDQMLFELARKRINTAYQYLTSRNGVAPQQVTTVFPDNVADELQNSGSGVTVTLTAIGR